MEQIGLVKSVSGNRAEVEIRRISGCGGSCKTCSGCDTPSNLLLLKNDINAEVGDLVKIKGEMKSLLKKLLIVYMIPFVGLMIGLLLGMNLFKSLGFSNYEFKGFLLGIVTMGIGYLVVKKCDDKIAGEYETDITMIEVIED